jgi:16S rRNA (guanine527-N7)-methyltransferase
MELSEQLHRLDLKVDQEAFWPLGRLVDELLRWNPRRNLTAITDYDEIVEKHLVDSLTLLPFARQSSRLLDIGSGAGFPSLPLKIVCPQLEIVSVDAVGKKIDFQRHVVRSLGLKGFKAVHARVESLTEEHATFDLVTARALCSLKELVARSEPFLAPGGCLLAMKGPEGGREFFEQQEDLLETGWSVALHRLKLPLSGAERCLVELTR